jgi:hypothetical protein
MHQNSSAPKSFAEFQANYNNPAGVLPNFPNVAPVMAAIAIESKPATNPKKRIATEIDRKTPTKKDRATPTKKDRAAWSCELVESLIELRYCPLAKKKWGNCKSNREKANWWKWLAEFFNNQNSVDFDVEEVKNRFKRLKTEWRAICTDEIATGNTVAMKKPAYWEVMLENFQVNVMISSDVKQFADQPPSTIGELWPEVAANLRVKRSERREARCCR